MRRLLAALLLIVGLTSASYALSPGAALILNSGCPYGASFFLNLAQGTGCGGTVAGSLSVVRATPPLAYAQKLDGTLVGFAPNTARITDLGLLPEEARTNKSTNFSANPTALVAMGTLAAFNAAGLANVTATGGSAGTLFGVVDDTAALAAAGLANVCTSGRVYKIDNTTGTATAGIIFTGQTGNTNNHSMSAYIRGTAGSFIRDDANSGQTGPFGTASYARYQSANYTPTATTRQMQISVAQGFVGFFILNQLEEGAFVTSPIVVAGASVIRAADVISLTGPALTAALNAKAAFFQTSQMNPTSVVANILLQYGAGAVLSVNGNTTILASNNVVGATATFGSGTRSGTLKSAFGMDATSFTSIANAGTQTVQAAAWINNTGTLTLGNRPAGDRALNAYLSKFGFGSTKGEFDGATSLP